MMHGQKNIKLKAHVAYLIFTVTVPTTTTVQLLFLPDYPLTYHHEPGHSSFGITNRTTFYISGCLFLVQKLSSIPHSNKT